MTSRKNQERITAVSRDILSAFEEGRVPEAMAQVLVRGKVDVPSKHWSWMNRLVGLMQGHVYAAGYRQWQMLGRAVKSGERAFYILGPRFVKAAEDEEGETDEREETETKKRLAGFVAMPVFGYLQTEGDPLPGLEDEVEFIQTLPLIEVAREWGLSVGTYVINDMPGTLGFHQAGKGIGLATRNLSTWAHELIHAADTLLGIPKISKLDAEVVAEFGGAILLEAMGRERESDRGGCFEYISHYAKLYDKNPLSVCHELLDRACRCVSFLLDQADQLAKEREEVLEGEAS